jgi:hypothetical protein
MLLGSHLSLRGSLHFHYALGFATQTLAYMLDSLVRVSRRVGYNHFVHITMSQIPREGVAPKGVTLLLSLHSHMQYTRGYNRFSRDQTLPPPRTFAMAQN